MWNLKGTYQWNRKRLTDIENRLVVAKEGRTGSWGWADEICLCTEWIKNEVLHYGTGKCIQYLGINHNAKEYTCQAESIFCRQKRTILRYILLIFKNLYARQQKRCLEQSFGLCRRGRGWDDLGECHWNMYNIIYETNRLSRFNAWYWMLGAGELGRPGGIVWGGRREGGFRMGNTCTPVANSC